MNLHGGYIKRAKTAKKWQRKNGSGVGTEKYCIYTRVDKVGNGTKSDPD